MPGGQTLHGGQDQSGLCRIRHSAVVTQRDVTHGNRCRQARPTVDSRLFLSTQPTSPSGVVHPNEGVQFGALRRLVDVSWYRFVAISAVDGDRRCRDQPAVAESISAAGLLSGPAVIAWITRRRADTECPSDMLTRRSVGTARVRYHTACGRQDVVTHAVSGQCRGDDRLDHGRGQLWSAVRGIAHITGVPLMMPKVSRQ